MSTNTDRSIGNRSKAQTLAAFVLLAAVAAPASAAIITVANVNKSVTYVRQNNVFELQSFDVAGFTVQFGFSGNAGNEENPFIVGNNSLGTLRVRFTSTAAKLGVGATIQATQSLYTQVVSSPFEGAGSQWVGADVVDGYVGLMVQAADSSLHFGYAHFRYDDPNNTITLLDYAYESAARTGLTVTAVPTGSNLPEPGSLALSLLSLAGFAKFSRRKS